MPKNKTHVKKIHISPALSNLVDNLSAPIPPNEKERLSILYQYLLLDSSPYDASYDRYTALCHRIFKVKAVSISLVDADNLYLKSKVGIECSVTDRHSSFAAHAILPQCPDLFEVKNALEDDRFANNFRVVGFPYWRFYAGVALIVDGVRIGSLSLMDTKVRSDFNKEDRLNLLEFASAISSLMTMKRNAILHLDRPFQTMEQKILASCTSFGKKKKKLKIKKDSHNQRSIFPDTSSQHPSSDMIIYDSHDKSNMSDQLAATSIFQHIQSNLFDNNNNNENRPTTCRLDHMVESVNSKLSNSNHSIELEWSIDDNLSDNSLLCYPSLFVESMCSIFTQASDYWLSAMISLQFIHHESNNCNNILSATDCATATAAATTPRSSYMVINIRISNPIRSGDVEEESFLDQSKIEVRHIEENLATVGGMCRKSNIFTEFPASTSSFPSSPTTSSTKSNGSDSTTNSSSHRIIVEKLIVIHIPCDTVTAATTANEGNNDWKCCKESSTSMVADGNTANNDLLYRSLFPLNATPAPASSSSELARRVGERESPLSLSLDAVNLGELNCDALSAAGYPPASQSDKGNALLQQQQQQQQYVEDELEQNILEPRELPPKVKPATSLLQRWRLSLYSLLFPNNNTNHRQQQIRPFASSIVD